MIDHSEDGQSFASDEVLGALRAAGEPTRLRILATLRGCELTVTELCRVLGQTQPRVCRHLRLLCEAGLLERHPQGTSAFYRRAATGPGRALLDAVLPLIDHDDPVLRRDQERLDAVRAERAARAADYFEMVAADWHHMRDRHVGDAEVERSLLDAVDDLVIDDLLDIGTGTGRMLELFADRIERGVGIDLSSQMLNLARSQLDEAGLTHCAVRHGNVYDLDLPDGSIDVAILHHVLHFLDEPDAAIARAAASLRPNGRLLIVDFARHELDTMRAEFAHHWLGFDAETVNQWCHTAGLSIRSTRDLRRTTTNTAADPTTELVVRLWVAERPVGNPRPNDPHAPTPTARLMEAAS